MGIEVILVLVALFAVALFAGAFGALAGLGGGIIIVPVLTLFFKVNVHYAIGASIVSVIATSSGAAATYIKANITNVRVGLFLEMATTVGALTGAFVGAFLAGPVLFFIFGIVLGVSAIVMWGKRQQELPEGVVPDNWSRKLKLGNHYYDTALHKEVPYEVTGTRLALGMMYVAGLVSGLLGIGSGALKVPAMDFAMKLPIKVSSATSNFMIGVTAAASAGVYLARGYINPYLAAPVALGVLGGSIIGTHLLMVLKGSFIRKLFIGILVILTLEMLLRAFGIGF
ncbi:MAG TPA: sulfite exporter TauE/SafE family protein [Chloroflexia bacterium]|nr:sulfite exporter TauE/SafE family protein [Chloroflexia bacterium]